MFCGGEQERGEEADGARLEVDVHFRHKVGVGTLSQKQLSSSTRIGGQQQGDVLERQEIEYLEARIYPLMEYSY